MPVLPLIDLMLLSGWTSLFVGFVLKAIHLSTSYRPTILGLTPFERPDPRLVAALERAGATPVLDLGRDPGRAEAALAETVRLTRGRFAVRVPDGVRLEDEGDFNVDIDRRPPLGSNPSSTIRGLVNGSSNTLVLTATDTLNNVSTQTVTITGVSIHPGEATGKLVNAIHLASRIIGTLPQATMTPETTADREGFIHAVDMKGDAAEMVVRFILRDFERDGLAAKGALLRQVCDAVAATEPRARITVEITPQYRNMRYWLEDDMGPVELARDALRDLGLEPVETVIRGGTDGSRLTEMGVPCPNLFTGMQNVHGPLEYVSVQDMAKATDLMLAIAARAAAAAPERPAGA